jgi:aspartyl-tRNA(Asn)/glutamyl-tRNA(Gln) amidotransferase subunit B
MKYIPTIGLEIHLQLNTLSKMFCACSNRGEFEPPNSTICPICLAHPGTLPTINREAVRSVIKAGIALKGNINQNTKLDRKNYFYPDLPKGYQISQYDLPIVAGGVLTLDNGTRIRIRRIHIEEDTAKLLHASDGTSTLVDFNRSGSPLMELVTEPDCHDAATAKKICQELQLLFRTLDISDADMEKGHMRCETNISIAHEQSEKMGTKVEVKNINSFRAVEKAILYEVKRQENLLEQDEKVVQETRGWNDEEEITVSQRSKEEAHDYRYFPEPDLPPLQFSDEFIEEIRKTLPELPLEKRKRFREEYRLSPEFAELISVEKPRADWFEQVMSELEVEFSDIEPSTKHVHEYKDVLSELSRLTVGWMLTELLKLMNLSGSSFKKLKVSPENFAELMILIHENKVNSSAAQTVLKEMFDHGLDPHVVLSETGLEILDAEAILSKYILEVIQTYPEQIKQYQNGKTNVIQFLVGKAMALSGGKANPQKIRELFADSISKRIS